MYYLCTLFRWLLKSSLLEFSLTIPDCINNPLHVTGNRKIFNSILHFCYRMPSLITVMLVCHRVLRFTTCIDALSAALLLGIE